MILKITRSTPQKGFKYHVNHEYLDTSSGGFVDLLFAISTFHTKLSVTIVLVFKVYETSIGMSWGWNETLTAVKERT